MTIELSRATQGAFICFRGGYLGATWTDQPAGLAEFAASTSGRLVADLSAFGAAMLTVRVNTAGAASAELRVQYSLDETTWAYLDGSAGPACAIGASGTKVGGWVTIAAAARTQVFLRLVGINGDGVADPAIGNVTMQLR